MLINSFSSHNDILNEKKDHIINKLKNLSATQKEYLINFFNTNPSYESKIDWNNKNLNMDDFNDVMKLHLQAHKIKAKRHVGVSGLTEKEDYIQLDINSDIYNAYIPLNWKASKILASSKIMGCEGKWCIAYEQSESYWKDYVIQRGQVPIYVMGNDTKYAVMIERGNTKFTIWDDKDNAYTDEYHIPEINIHTNILNSSHNVKIIEDARNSMSKVDNFIEQADTTKAVYHVDNGTYIWESGSWNSGVWSGGVWQSGVFRDGTWHSGDWLDGFWDDGVWHKGRWTKGDWHDGIWKDGVWEGGSWFNGTWLGGVWKGGKWKGGDWYDGVWEGGSWFNGIWLGGVWKGGKWHGGYDDQRTFHTTDDSPDKW